MCSKVGSWHVGVVESSLLCHSSSFFLWEFGLAGIFPGNRSVRDICVVTLAKHRQLLFSLIDLEIILFSFRVICIEFV